MLQVDSVDGKNVVKNVLPCALDGATQDLIQLIFSNDMFKEAMECMNLGGCVSVNQPFIQTVSKCSVYKLYTCRVTFLLVKSKPVFISETFVLVA